MAFTSMFRIKQLFVREALGSFYFKLYYHGVPGVSCDALENTQEAGGADGHATGHSAVQTKFASKLNEDIFQPESWQ